MGRINTYEVTHCPFCNRQIATTSPPSSVRYDAGEVHIAFLSTVLLPQAIVDANAKANPGKFSGHTANLEGYYCNVECLTGYIKQKLSPPKRKRKAKAA